MFRGLKMVKFQFVLSFLVSWYIGFLVPKFKDFEIPVHGFFDDIDAVFKTLKTFQDRSSGCSGARLYF